MPGSFNGLVARMTSDLGFNATYLSGAALTASRGVPDIGLLSLEAFTQAIEDIYHSSGLPLIADADTGFGEGEMCAKTVWQYSKAGAAGLHIEDQQFPKRCGHLDGKSLIAVEDMVKKIEICADTRDKCSNGDFIICARTDARGVEGIESTLSRSKAYIDAGADMIFPEGLENVAEFEYVAQNLRSHKPGVFLLANMTEFGKTPLINFSEFERMGYSCVIYPVSTLRVAMGAVAGMLQGLKETGSVEGSIDKMLTRKELYGLLNYTPGKEWMYPGTKK
ncbi:hypothetical protein FGO68_gene3531 [Halteria grandinella]|uniref:Methylisocitrate lyase n=1 Tax=Halteria grandinella TaxID=5974 RepID=A0A8J8NJP6_HALGN|nr:hypothetical protein FGO68_gene3531 [Halteria grandinella]